MVHRRELDGKPVVFGNQGDLWNNAMTWFDHDTGSVWSQVTGEAIMGPLTGRRLEMLPSTLTTWGDWQARFPETLALDKFTRETRFSLDDTAVVVATNDDSVALPVPALRDAGIVALEIGGEPVSVVFWPGTDRWIAFSRIVDGEAIELELGQRVVVDPSTGRTWDGSRGVALDDHTALDIVPAFSAFPADYARIFPDGRVWTPDALVPAEEFTDSRSPTR